MASILGGLLLVGLGRMRSTFDQLLSFRSMREGIVQLATKAEQEGRLTPEYLSQFGITNRKSPEELVDDLIRRQGFQWLSLDFAMYLQREPWWTNPRLLMDPGLARRYGLQTRPMSPVSTTPSTNATSPESAAPAPQPMMMSQELMKRYGLLPKRPSRTPASTPPKTSTNPPANPAPGQ
jgi:hypothetical protein